MAANNIDIRPINLRSASDEEYLRLNALRNVIRLEILPEDPPWPCSEEVHRWQARPALVQDNAWAAWDHDRVAALALTQIHHTGDNPHLIEFEIQVLPEFRRQGLGRRLLGLVAEHARSSNRHLLMTECNDRVPAGIAFLQRIGARKGLDATVNQLRIADLDHQLIERWLEREPVLSREFSLALWDKPYPEERLADIAGLMQVVGNDQPRDNLDMEDINYTPELVRQWDASQRAGGDERWTLYLDHLPDRRLAGVTEVYWNPNRPALLWQGFTGVMPEYRSRGLGSWLKASMLKKILRERPQVQFIRAGNAESNAPMLKINRTLGFRRLVAWAVWQVELESVEQYLSSRN